MKLPSQSAMRKLSDAWTPAELGAYLRLLWHATKHGGLPDTATALGRIIGTAYTNVHRYKEQIDTVLRYITGRYIATAYIAGRYIITEASTPTETPDSVLKIRELDATKFPESGKKPLARALSSYNTNSIDNNNDDNTRGFAGNDFESRVKKLIELLEGQFPEQHLAIAKNQLIDAAAVPDLRRRWAELHVATTFNDAAHIRNSWSFFCRKEKEQSSPKKSEPAAPVYEPRGYEKPNSIPQVIE
jgi:hypothetical protein